MLTSTRIGKPMTTSLFSSASGSSGFELFTVVMKVKSGAAVTMLDGSRMTAKLI